MIDEKKIEEAAEKIMSKQFYSFFENIKDYRNQSKKDFIAGINWFLDNIWHDASEDPKKDKLVLTDTRSIANKEHICWQAVKLSDNGFIRNWSNYVKATKITRWLYMEDLMKGGN